MVSGQGEERHPGVDLASVEGPAAPVTLQLHLLTVSSAQHGPGPTQGDTTP
jgi:hypothetical protein